MSGALGLVVAALALGGAPPAAPPTEPAADRIVLTVTPEVWRIRAGERLRFRVSVRGAAELVGGTVTVRLVPPDPRGRALRQRVIVLPDSRGVRVVTIGIDVPRTATPGRYALTARLLDESTAEVAARFAARRPVRVRPPAGR